MSAATMKTAFENAEAVDLWPEPRELPGGLLPVREFSCDVLPVHLRDWVQDVSERMQTPPEYVAVPAMVAASCVVGRKVVMRPKQVDDWEEVPNLWGCIVGRPGVLKSPAMKEALKPLSRLKALASEQYEAAASQYAAGSIERDLRKDAAKAAMKKALGADPKADVSHLRIDESEDVEPTLRRYDTNDSSYQALGELLRFNPNGVMVFKDELTGLLRPLDREENTEAKAFYLQGWNGNGDYTFDRIGRGSNLRVPSVTLSVLGSTQPAKIQPYVDGVVGGAGDDGMLQRFALTVWPDLPPKWEYIDRAPRAEYRQAAFDVFDHLDALTGEAVGATVDPTGKADAFLRFDHAAQARFVDWLDGLMSRVLGNELHPAMESHLSKYRSLIPSMALLHHLMGGNSGPVGELSVLSALAWAEYLESHALRLYGAAVNAEASAAKVILRHLKAGDLEDGFSRRDIERKGWSGLHSNAEKIDAAINLLLDYGQVVPNPSPEPSASGGRPPLPTFNLNPRVRG